MRAQTRRWHRDRRTRPALREAARAHVSAGRHAAGARRTQAPSAHARRETDRRRERKCAFEGGLERGVVADDAMATLDYRFFARGRRRHRLLRAGEELAGRLQAAGACVRLHEIPGRRHIRLPIAGPRESRVHVLELLDRLRRSVRARARGVRVRAPLARGRTQGLSRSRSRSPLPHAHDRSQRCRSPRRCRRAGRGTRDGRMLLELAAELHGFAGCGIAVRQRPRSKSAEASSRSACGKRASAAACRAPSSARRARRAASSLCPSMNRPLPAHIRCSADWSSTPAASAATSARSSRPRPPGSPATEVAASSA